MKSTKYILTGAIAAYCASAAYAQTSIYITGATAYRTAAVTAIENLYGAGNYKCVWGAKTGVSDEKGATHASFQGTIATLPALGVVTVKVAWAGSVGGLKIIANPAANINDQPGAKGWIPNADFPVGNTTVSKDETLIAFEAGALAAKADSAFSDCFAATVGVAGLTGNGVGAAATGNVGVVPFEWVANNGVTAVSVINAGVYAAAAVVIPYTGPVTGSPLLVGKVIGGKGFQPNTKITAFTAATITIDKPTIVASTAASVISAATTGTNPLTDIQQLQARAVLSGGAYLSQFTGVGVADAANVFVYALGRNADSGTRVSCLAESGLGALGNPQHIQPTITGGGAGGTGGTPARKIASVALWPAEVVLGVPYAVGRSGYSGGGDLANAMSAWGSVGVPTTVGGTAPLYQSRVGADGGWLVGYITRSDAERACAQTGGANTAHRISFNGQVDWNIVAGQSATSALNFTHDGKPVSGYNDAAIQQGKYTLWEFEHFYRNAAASANANKVAYLNGLAANIIAVDPGVVSIPLTSMKVSRPNEGGLITHIVTP